MWFSAKCSERNFLRDQSQYLNTAVKYSLLLPLEIELCKKVLPSTLQSIKNMPVLFFEWLRETLAE